MNKRLTLAAALLALTAPAVAGGPHNVRFYSILDEGAQLSADGGAAEAIGPNSVNFYHFEPGAHSFSLTTASGDTVSLDTDFEDANMSTSRGRSWWCLVAGRRSADHVLVFLFDTQAQCQSMLAVAPTDDDPADSGK